MASQLAIHYHRYDADYKGWTLWTWLPGYDADAREVCPAREDEFGLVFLLAPTQRDDSRGLGILPRRGEWIDKDPPDRLWTPALGHEVYIVQADRAVYQACPSLVPRVVQGFIDAPTSVAIELNTPAPVQSIIAQSVELTCDGRTISVEVIEPFDEHAGLAKSYVLTTRAPFDLDHARCGACTAALPGTEPGLLQPRYILDDPFFYTDLPLGPHVSADELLIRVWAPCARSVRVVLTRECPLPAPVDAGDASHAMTAIGAGTWELRLTGDFRNWWYRFDSCLIHEPGVVRSVIDPYARAVSRVESAAQLVDDQTPVRSGPTFDITDAVIYEVHVRDATIDPSSGVNAAGTYAGLVEEHTHMPDDDRIATGLAHFRELGVNTLQFMPLHLCDMDESATSHAWGYMTLHFNAPEYIFATDRAPATAVRELKQMIDTLHRRGFKVIMDVVYNHSTESASHAVHWNGLAPHYFYRTRPDGSYWNGSGCGNEFRSEGPMARRFLVDSLLYWMNDYGVDGFRFDLMGLIDRDTMIAVVHALRSAKPGVFVYGEPWPGGDTPTRITGKGDQKRHGFGCFNDNYRAAIAGGVFDPSPGYAFDGRNRSEVIKGLEGSHDWFTALPSEAINYVECHDNRTLRDKIAQCVKAGTADLQDNEMPAVDRLAAVLLLFAQGVPFLHLGQDFYRTKFGEENSYNSGDEINRIRWEWKREHLDLCEFYRGLIALRSAHPVFRLRSHREVSRRLVFGIVPAPYIVCEFECDDIDDEWRCAYLLVNPTADPWVHASPNRKVQWHVHIDAARASLEALYALAVGQKDIVVQPRSAVLLAQVAGGNT